MPQLSRDWNPAVGRNLAHLGCWLGRKKNIGVKRSPGWPQPLHTRPQAVVAAGGPADGTTGGSQAALLRRAVESVKGECAGSISSTSSE